MELAERLVEGLAALRLGEPERAAGILAQVCQDPDFSAEPELRDVYARACSLHAQALLMAGEPAQARRPLRDALDALQELGDSAAIAQVRELEQQIGQAMTEQFQAMAQRRELRALASRPLEDVLADLPTPSRRADAAIRWSQGALAHGRASQAAIAAERAFTEAAACNDVRHQVLARITWSLADPDRAAEHLETARAIADAADEFNLVGAVARAASQAGIELPPPPSVDDG